MKVVFMINTEVQTREKNGMILSCILCISNCSFFTPMFVSHHQSSSLMLWWRIAILLVCLHHRLFNSGIA